MASNVYEGMFILDTTRYGRDPAGVSGQITGVIESHGGEILVSRLWEERRLAYPIKGQRRGTYWLTYFRIEGEKISPLNRKCDLDENILRSLVVKVDPRIVGPLVSHALGIQDSSETSEEGESEEKLVKTSEDEGSSPESGEVASVAAETSGDESESDE